MEHFEVLGVDAERDGDKVVGRCTGPLADVVDPFFQVALARMSRSKPLAVRDGGNVSPCDFTPLIFGNILKDDLKTIWERMTSFEEYSGRKQSCHMQTPQFREKYLTRIVASGVKLPYDIYEDKARIFKDK